MAVQRSIAGNEGTQTLSTDTKVLRVEGPERVADMIEAPFAGEQAQDSIARTSAILAEFGALHRTVLNWA